MPRIDRSQNWVLRSTYQQTQTGLLWIPPAMVSAGQNNSPGLMTTREGIQLKSFMLHNRAAAAITVGIGGRLPNRMWVAGQWDASETGAEYIADTTDAQDVGTNDFALETTTNSDGFVVAALVPFHWASVRVSTAGVDGAGTTDRAVHYTNAAGSDWTALSSNQTFVDNFTSTNTVWASGENVFAWKPPADWGPIATGGLSGIPAGYYALRVTTTDAPDTTAALALAMEIGLMPFMREGVGDNEFFAAGDIHDDGWLEECDAMVALFSTLNAGNTVTAEVRTR